MAPHAVNAMACGNLALIPGHAPWDPPPEGVPRQPPTTSSPWTGPILVLPKLLSLTANKQHHGALHKNRAATADLQSLGSKVLLRYQVLGQSPLIVSGAVITTAAVA